MDEFPPTDEAAGYVTTARGGSREALGEALESCRAYLLLVANRELDDDLQAKGAPSDLVQETFLEAQRDLNASAAHGTRGYSSSSNGHHVSSDR